MSQLFTSSGQSTGVSASTSVLPMNTQDWSPLKWTSWISLQSKGLWRVFSNTTVQKHQFFGAQLYVAFLVVQRLKRLPAMQATWVQSLGREDPLEKEMATHSSILAWRTPCTEEPSGLQSMGSQRVGHDWATSLSISAFFIVQLSHPYMTTGKTILLTRRTFVGKVMSLLFNMLSRLVITFLPRTKSLLISWLQSPSAVIFGAQKNKVWHCFHCFPIYFHEVMGPDAMILVFWMLSV